MMMMMRIIIIIIIKKVKLAKNVEKKNPAYSFLRLQYIV